MSNGIPALPHWKGVVMFQVLEVDMDVSRIGGLPFSSALHVLNPLQGSIRASRETQVAWFKSDYYDVLEQANDQVERLLMVEWLVNTDDYRLSSGVYSIQGELLIAEKWQKEMMCIRRFFSPKLVIRLHSLLYFQLTKSNMTWRIAYKKPTTTHHDVHIYIKKVEFVVLLHVPTAGSQYLSF